MYKFINKFIYKKILFLLYSGIWVSNIVLDSIVLYRITTRYQNLVSLFVSEFKGRGES